MKKGIIMEIDDAHLTLLTPEGEFLRARRQDHPYTMGEEIHFSPIESVNYIKPWASVKNIFKYKSVWAAIAVLFFFLSSFIPLNQTNNAYAYMSIDANPSIEFGVNKKMQVVELTGFNKEGKKIVSELNDWKKKDVSELTKSILVEMKKAGLLTNNEHVIITTVRTEKPEKKAEKELQKKMNSIKEAADNQKLDLIVLIGTEKEREKAREHGISTGKYQENKNQSSQKEKQNTIEKKQEQKAISSETNKAVSPGQQKKQGDDVQNNGLTESKPEGGTKGWEGNSIPPGQLKKADEDQWKQNQGNQNQGNQNHGNQNQGNQNQGNQNHGNQNQGNQNHGNQNQGNQNHGNQNQGNQNQGQFKNQGQQQGNGNQQNKWNQKQQENDSNQQNHWNQKNHKNE
ncbi:anti-sigma factor domain-containing protein [Neobacillus sp. NPDC097160]|uniref:anti-sigma factor domain-containing protein n=1 Tax=Neobacillus sp. NPDC097160 TaxID=3364298 RepID=UPI0038309CBD